MVRLMGRNKQTSVEMDLGMSNCEVFQATGLWYINNITKYNVLGMAKRDLFLNTWITAKQLWTDPSSARLIAYNLIRAMYY